SSSRTGRVPPVISPQRPSCVRQRMAIRSSLQHRRTRSTRHSMTSSISISSATSRRSPALWSCPTSWWCIHQSRPRPFRNSLLSPRPIQARSTWLRPASGVSGEQFRMMTGVNLVHVPYRGNGPALADLLAAQVRVMFPTMPSSIAYISAGKLRPLAVTTTTRSDELPQVPTVNDFVPGYEASNWYGIGAPKGTPVEIIDKLNKEINAALGDPKMKARLADLGGTPLLGSPADFGRLIAEETEKWGNVIRALNIKAE